MKAVHRNLMTILMALFTALSLALMPANASAMIECIEVDVAEHHAAPDTKPTTASHAPHHGYDDAGHPDQPGQHCASHSCVVGVTPFRTVAESTHSLSMARFDADAGSRVATADPDGVLRPPRA